MKKTVITLLLCFGIFQNAFSQDFYDINTINTIEITFTQSNWDHILDSLYAAGNEERLVGTAVINGVQFDSVGVHYKGNSSYNPNRIKNPLNIKLDHIIEDQTLDGYGTLKLANVYKDPSFVREVLSYEIARKYMPASKANYIRVFINGTYLGLYTSVQSVDKFFMGNHFNSNENARFKGELANDSPQNPVVVWGYLGSDSTNYYDYYELKSDRGWQELVNFLDTLNNYPADVEDVLNVDRHLWMLAFDILMVNLDAPVNFGHNFYLYKDDAGQFNPIIWDLNENFGAFSMLLGPGGGPLNLTGMQQLDPFLNSTNPNYPIVSKILTNPVYKKMFVAHMKTIMNEIFANGWYRNRALEIQAIIDAEVQADPNKFYTYNDFLNNIDHTVGGGPGPGGQPIVGITQLMAGRLTFLNSQPEFQAAAPQISNVSSTPSIVTPNSEVWITAEVSGASVVKLGWRNSSSDRFEKIEMFDDGNHQDGLAGDGVYGVSVIAGAGQLQYYIYAENADAAAFSPARAEYEFYSIDVTAGDLVINEFMADNDNTVPDPAGEYDDWIELYNNSSNAISLNGYYLSDDGNDLTQWSFPDTSIAANGYLIIWADDDLNQAGLHANFKLSKSGEAIYLVAPDTSIIDEVTFAAQKTDTSTGRYPNGTGDFAMMLPSFASENSSPIVGITDTLYLTPTAFSLEQNYPNPFNPVTTIRYQLSTASLVELTIYNLNGQKVRTLVNERKPAGNYQIQWDGRDDSGRQVASGVYLYRIRAGAFSQTKKMILMK
ncbi:MAG: hypothetical protein Kow0042_16230 [Calditrichia bacterium]